jgi:hypothetical protein
MSKNILFITETLFKERTGASVAIDGKQIFPIIKVAQDIYVQGAVGSTLYNRLQEGIDNDDLNNDEKALLDNYITDCLIWFTMSLLPMTMGYQLFSKGFLQKTAEESTTPDQKALELIESRYKELAEFYKQRLINYLKENYTTYQEYLNNTAAYDVIFPEQSAYTCPIYIGEPTKRPTWINQNSGTLTLNEVKYVANGGETTFTVADIAGRSTLLVIRDGLGRAVTTTPTANTMFLQIINDQVTLPTGDVALAGELFVFLYK